MSDAGVLWTLTQHGVVCLGYTPNRRQASPSPRVDFAVVWRCSVIACVAKTIRAYLNGDRAPGIRQPAGPDAFKVFIDYVTARLTEDPHLWAATLLDELRPLGFEGSYPTLTRQIRARGLRPPCVACSHVTNRPNAVIEHPPGRRPSSTGSSCRTRPRTGGSPTKRAYLLVGSLAHSGVWRAVISPSMDIPHLLAAMTTLLGLLGGLTRVWRFDRMATVLHPSHRCNTISRQGPGAR